MVHAASFLPDEDLWLDGTNPFHVWLQEGNDLRVQRKREKDIAEKPWIRSRQRVTVDRLKDVNICDGDRRLKEIEWALDTMSPTRSSHQKRFHKSFINACLPHIYGYDQWGAHKTRVLKMRRIDRIYMGVLAMTERRFGKTHMAAQFEAAVLYVIPQLESLVFSTGRRASSSFMRITRSYICALPMGADRIIADNQEDLQLGFGTMQRSIFKRVKTQELMKRMKMSANSSVMHSLPASGDRLRGVTGAIVFMEEAAYIDPKTFHTVIVPLMKIQHSTILGISTPSDRFNYYSSLFQACDQNGNPLFEQLTVRKVCGACQEAQTGCPHVPYEPPTWNPIGRARLVEWILRDSPELLQREAQGIVATDSQPIFQPRWIATLETRPTHEFDPQLPFEAVYVGVGTFITQTPKTHIFIIIIIVVVIVNMSDDRSQWPTLKPLVEYEAREVADRIKTPSFEIIEDGETRSAPFDPVALGYLQQRQPHDYTNTFEYVYVAIDPSQGAGRDGYAMSMLTYDSVNGVESPVLLGSDVSKSQELDDVVRMIIDRLSSANKHPNRSASHCVYAMIIESNTGYFDVQGLLKHTYEWAAKECREGRMTYIYSYRRDITKADRAGVWGTWTSNEEKRLQATDMQHCLSYGALAFARQYIAGRPTDPGAVEREKKALITELMNVRDEVLFPKTVHGKITHTITGKTGNKCDDRWMALALAYTNSLRLRNGSRALEFRTFCMTKGVMRV